MKTACALALVVVAGSCGKSTEDGQKTAAKSESTAKATTQSKVESEIKKVAPGAMGKAAGSEFGVESAKIVFKHSGFEVGTVTAWVKDHGKTVVLDRDMTKPMAGHTHVVWKDGQTVMWGADKPPYTTKLRSKDSELRLVSTTDAKQLEMAGYKKKPNETVAGQECEVWHSDKQNVTLWRWNGIDLKYVNGAVKGIVAKVEATEVVTPAQIPPEMMTPPPK